MLEVNQLSGQPVLTEREHQILELVAVGLSAKEVAQQILIAPRTVERHIENIRLKMRARNRTHMVTCAALSGLLVAAAPDEVPIESVAAQMPDHRDLNHLRATLVVGPAHVGQAMDLSNEATTYHSFALRAVPT